MIRRPPRSTLSSSSAASDVYKRQVPSMRHTGSPRTLQQQVAATTPTAEEERTPRTTPRRTFGGGVTPPTNAVSYTHLRAHETPEHLVCRLLLEKKKKKFKKTYKML
eukprot:TRINITY_DN19684_c0_g1_i1.p1 TRINITY_DN19684_c0_g1~~TRINITY_DN19684_c0_g1_i1.p1  ORF type:complete len:107 (+),score=31.96 TRINITY_DN19684_c0_g1_i1:105-425(+)